MIPEDDEKTSANIDIEAAATPDSIPDPESLARQIKSGTTADLAEPEISPDTPGKDKVGILKKTSSMLTPDAALKLLDRLRPNEPITFAIYVALALFGAAATVASWGDPQGFMQSIVLIFGFGFLGFVVRWIVTSRDPYWRRVGKIAGTFLLSVVLLMFMFSFIFWMVNGFGRVLAFNIFRPSDERVVWVKNLDAIRLTSSGMGSSEENSCGFRYWVHREQFVDALKALSLESAPDLKNIRDELLAAANNMPEKCGSDDWYNLAMSPVMKDLHSKLVMGLRAKAIEVGADVQS